MNLVRALHLFANFKWTGPADPAIRTAKGLRELGADVVFAQAQFMHGGEHWMSAALRRSRMPVTGDLQLPKHYGPLSALHDSRVLARRLRRGDFNVLHANLLTDHVSASLANRLASGRAVLVRTIHEPESPLRNLRNRFAFGNTDGVVVPTQGCAETVAERFSLAPDRILIQEPTTDVHRFERVRSDLREYWSLSDRHVVIGVTARIQPHRRFELLWEVAREVVKEVPHARFVLLGRGNEIDTRTLVHEPIERLGLAKHVVLPGYLEEPDYTRALRSLDLFMFMVPGSDETCRAVREAMAASLPVVTTRRGILPELVGERTGGPAPGACGLIVEEETQAMCRAVVDLARDQDRRRALGRASRHRVMVLMGQSAASRRLLDFYGVLRGLRG